MLRRHDVDGGFGRLVEYHGPGLAALTAMDRHVIANMGAEFGATTTVFPSDGEVRRFLTSERREDDWVKLLADEDASYDVEEEIDLSLLEPLIVLPSSQGNVRPVREVAGPEISQALIGSSAKSGPARLRDRRSHRGVGARVGTKPRCPATPCAPARTPSSPGAATMDAGGGRDRPRRLRGRSSLRGDRRRIARAQRHGGRGTGAKARAGDVCSALDARAGRAPPWPPLDPHA
jgi:hypothetical protein